MLRLTNFINSPRHCLSSLFCLLVLFSCLSSGKLEAREFRKALPGYNFAFPQDHASHDQFKTEWWYYTGHLKSNDNKTYGFELTFFRVGQDQEASKSSWRSKNLYLAHFAITDENNKTFNFFEKLNRDNLDVASASQSVYRVTNEGWIAEQLGNNFCLRANTPELGLELFLHPVKSPVIHGLNGVSQKAAGKGCASHYYSMTRLEAEGLLTIDNKPIPVFGQAWMDHEFGSNQLGKDQIGWDWFSIQLDKNLEIMLYVMRKSNGLADTTSSGTIIYPDGKCEHIKLEQFNIATLQKWRSPNTKAEYPIKWQISIPSIKAKLQIEPTVLNQELVTKNSTGVSYWEGSCKVQGTINNESRKGVAYVEMTGYAERFKQAI